MISTTPRSSTVRALRDAADTLRLREGLDGNEPVYRALDALTTALARLERDLDASHTPSGALRDLPGISANLVDAVAKLAPEIRADVIALTARVRVLTAPSRSARVGSSLRGAIPFDLVAQRALTHAPAVACLGASLFARNPYARGAGAALGASALVLESIPVPQEVSGAARPVWGALAIAAPFALGYHRDDPFVAAAHIVAGASALLDAFARAARRRGSRAVSTAQ